ncbi:protocadherin Fat 4-like [Argopecten irradians]|uniref:protocadherin Fat 4-like n=1 Tax=Argopecten irradians TaxID=31199 RepID=UPI003712C612
MTSTCIPLSVFLGFTLIMPSTGTIPSFSSPSTSGLSHVSINEDTLIGTSVYHAIAYDSGYPVIYTISSGIGFTISGQTIYTSQDFDYETKTSYHLRISASSRGYTATVPLTVNIVDVNDNSPIFSPSVFTSTIPENSPAGTSVKTLSCRDADSGSNGLCTMRIQTGDDVTGKFTISGTTLVTTSTAIDYEALSSRHYMYTLVVIGVDSPSPTGYPIRTGTAYVYVTITGINEFYPRISGTSPSRISVSEDSLVGTTIASVLASDTDRGEDGDLNYSIIGGASGGQFGITEDTGSIYLRKGLDFETTQSYLLAVKVADSGRHVLSVTTTVTVTVTNVNDNTPVCLPSMHFISVLENKAHPAAVIYDLACTDHDSGTTLTYIMTQNPGNKFMVSTVGGSAALVLNESLDYETTVYYNLQVTVTDNGYPALSSTVSVDVTVLNVNEDRPVFAGTYHVVASEDTVLGSTLVTVTATDRDAGDTIDYGFLLPYPSFRMDPRVGTILLVRDLDYEASPSHGLLITASDGSLSTTSTVTITVDDVNEAPVFILSTYSVSFLENQPVRTPVLRVFAADRDAGANGRVSYRISGGDGASFFSIDSVSGMISTSTIIDYEVNNFSFLIIQASDAALPSLTTQCLVRVRMKDINDNSPVFIPSTFTTVITEGAPVGTTVITVTAADADSATDNNNVFEFSTTSGVPFTIHPTSGLIWTNSRLDRELTSSYEMVILATDKGPTPLTGTSTVTISLVDVNDNAPSISGTYDTTIDEDTGVNTVVFSVNATDLDRGRNKYLSYVIVSGNMDSDFRIDSKSGIIQTADTLDRERHSLYRMIIRVSDNGTPSRTASVTCTVTIGDVNDNFPVWKTQPFQLNIKENMVPGFPADYIRATDKDIGTNAALTYEIVNYWVGGSNPFMINSYSSLITSTEILDRESVDTYVLWCRVYDGGSPRRFTDSNVTITVLDLNDNNPVFEKRHYFASIQENSQIGTSVLIVSASDNDTGVNALLSYSIDTATQTQYLNINRTTGVLVVNASVDRERVSLFTVTVLATDAGAAPRTGSTEVSVSVQDVNDNSPVFRQIFYNAEVPNIDTCSSVVAMVTATDADDGPNALISYYFDSFSEDFRIDTTSGTISSSRKLTPNKRYIQFVNARDNGSPEREAVTKTTVRIDTYSPSAVVVAFHLGVTKTYFESVEVCFMSLLTGVFRTLYPTAIVKRWCLIEQSNSLTIVKIYVLQDDTTNRMINIYSKKKFLAASDVLSYVTMDAKGKPSYKITGTSWRPYHIRKVVGESPRDDDPTPWVRTDTGIGVITACVIVGFVGVTLASIKVVKCIKSKSSVDVNERVAIHENSKTSFTKRHPKDHGRNTAVSSIPKPPKRFEEINDWDSHMDL